MTGLPWPRALVDGAVHPLAGAALPLTDEGFGRGDGGFETVGVWDGKPFALDAHLERLATSLDRVLLADVDLTLLRSEIGRALEGVTGDAAMRLYVTASGTRIVTCDDLPDRRAPRRLVPYEAPWIQPPSRWQAAGAKTMSYLPNMVATRAARAAGGDDALLVSSDGVVLEGPTFGVCWFAGGVLCAPSVDLGIIDSTSRRVVLGLAADAGVDVREGVYPVEHLQSAGEVMVSSAIRDLIAVRRVGEVTFEGPTPLRDRLARDLAAVRRA
jgi:branched-subunit amino acid aminotransferase/4-amino-4-deoxychorismate lyase